MKINKDKGFNDYRSLTKYLRVKCDFCDKVFKNRYQAIKHNVIHIKISLRKSTGYVCPKCLVCLKSPKELKLHHELNHSISGKHEDNNDTAISQLNNNLNTNTNQQPNNKTNTILSRILFEDDNDSDIEYDSNNFTAISNGNNNITAISNEINNSTAISNEINNITAISNEKFTSNNNIDNSFVENTIIVKRNNVNETVVLSSDDECMDESNITAIPNEINNSSVISNEINNTIAIFNKNLMRYVCPKCLVFFMSPNELKLHHELNHSISGKHEENNDTAISQLNNMFNTNTNQRHNNKDNTISSRILFEDDNDSNIEYHGNNFTAISNGINNITAISNKKFTSSINIDNSFVKNTIIVERNNVNATVLSSDDGCMDETNNDRDERHCSYDSLVELGEFKCKYCSISLNSRFNLLQHNLLHIKRIRPPKVHLCEHCECFFENMPLLRAHLFEKHNKKYRIIKVHRCCQCNLVYCNWYRHTLRYHSFFSCVICKKKHYKLEINLVEHLDSHKDKNCLACNQQTSANGLQRHIQDEHMPKSSFLKEQGSIKVCDTCALFYKDRTGIRYVNLGSYHVERERCQCESCGNLFFELNRVQKKRSLSLDIWRSKIKLQLCKPKVAVSKIVTNEDRLKNIQKRMNKLKK